MDAQTAENAAAAAANREPRQLYAGDWSLFGNWFDRWVFCAKSLAEFQSPKYKAIAVAVAPMNQTPQAPQMIDTEPRDADERERRAANSYLTLVKG